MDLRRKFNQITGKIHSNGMANASDSSQPTPVTPISNPSPSSSSGQADSTNDANQGADRLIKSYKYSKIASRDYIDVTVGSASNFNKPKETERHQKPFESRQAYNAEHQPIKKSFSSPSKPGFKEPTSRKYDPYG